MPGRTVRPTIAIATMLALVLPGTAVAGPHRGTWSGPTGQGHEILFKVNGDERITHLEIEMDLEGTCSANIKSTWDGDARIRDDDTFTVKIFSGDQTLTVRGAFVTRRRAEGKARATLDSIFCYATGRTSWVAKRPL